MRRGRGDAGVMLVELLVGMVLMGVIGTIVLDGIVSSMQAQRNLQLRSEAQNAARTAAQRMTRVMREASYIRGATATTLDVQRTLADQSTQYDSYAFTGSGATAKITQTTTVVDPAGATTSTTTRTVIDQLDAATLPFSYSAATSWTPTSAVGADCLITGSSPSAYARDCIGYLTLRLSRVVPGHSSVRVLATVDWRNSS